MSAEYALPPELAQSKTDNAIIGFALNLSKTIDCTLVSKDINVRIKCDSLGLKSEDYLKMRVASAQDEIFGGVAHLEVEPRIIDGFYGGIPVSLGPELEKGLCPNQILVMKDHARSAIGKFIGPGEGIGKLIAVDEVFGLKPRNKEQCFALDLLLDDNIKLVSITGAAGCGKTLLSLAAGLQQVVGKGAKYEHLVVSRPVQPMGKDIGFLPGTIEEKMDPWVAPIKDNLTFLLGSRYKKQVSKKHGEPDREFKRDPYIEMFFEDKIEIEALTYIRGRSIPNSFMIIDECQNLTVHELKTIITRIGDGTKIVLLGDLEQIDNAGVDMFTNGLTYAVEKFKDYPIAGHITLLKGERSELATLAAKIL
jgi:PhoH-like ATPase